MVTSPSHHSRSGELVGEVEQKRKASGDSEWEEGFFLIFFLSWVHPGGFTQRPNTRGIAPGPTLALSRLGGQHGAWRQMKGFFLNSAHKPQNAVTPVTGENNCLRGKSESFWQLWKHFRLLY